nr:MAG TPA: nucleoid-associated protein [Caudoviricetes sp.]
MADTYKIKNITVRQKIATGDDTYIVCGNSDYTVHWDLDDEWAEYNEKTMLVRVDNSPNPYTVQFTGTDAELPALYNTRRCVIGLMAGDVRTTTGAMFVCLPSARDASGVPVGPPADVYAQLVSQLSRKISEPSQDGTAGQALVTDGNGGRSWATVQGGGGITPIIGDNGNWYLGDTDTGKPSRGATGAKGDPGPQGPAGKDGAGMDITGASVGQIAKIAAVDADGVPTAWSPVDMPGGGGGETWEKLVDASLAEAVESVTYTFDNCKRIRALIAPALSSGESVGGWKRITINNVSYPAFNNTVRVHDGLCVRIDSEYPPYWEVNLNLAFNLALNGINGGYYTAALENIAPNGVTEFGCQTAGLLKSGTKIEIWGVKS